MTLEELLKNALPLLGGGAAGAIITSIVTNKRNKIQPIGTFVSASGSILPKTLLSKHEAKITINKSGKDFQFSNIYVASIIISNNGNKDFATFDFGVTLPDDLQIINYSVHSKDRHHEILSDTDVTFETPRGYIDFNLTPFNRKDNYEIELTIAGDGEYSLDAISFSSGLPIRFVPLGIDVFPTVLDVLIKSLPFPVTEITKVVKTLRQ